MDRFIEIIFKDQGSVKVLWSIIIVIVLMIVSRLIKNVFYKSISDNKKYYTIKQKINYISGITIIVFILFIWMDSFPYLTTYIGLLSAGIAIAMKEIFIDMAGWLFIESRKPFEVGHRISIGGEKGDVIDKRLFQFSLMEVSSYEEGEQSTGRIVDIPNGFVFIHPTINFTKGFEYIWNEIKILLTFESDWQKAKQALFDIANKDTAITSKKAAEQLRMASKKYMIEYNKLTPIVYTDVKESGIQLTIRYLCSPKQRRTTSNEIWEDVLIMIQENDDIQLAYPTKRVVN
jgi:small-conductance mechanosensitive channel